MKKVTVLFASVCIISIPTLLWYTNYRTTELYSGEDLQQYLLDTEMPVTLAPLTIESGCVESNEDDCFYYFGAFRINTESGEIKNNEATLPLLSYPSDTELPDIDWRPKNAYTVASGDDTWGTCIEFNHSGIGKSGTHQRWTTTVLIPGTNTNAYKMAGYHWYQNSCEFLVSKPGKIIFRDISSATTAPGHAIYEYSCDKSQCSVTQEQEVVSITNDVISITKPFFNFK